ncbi:MAG: hypothetical protein WCJ64_00955 [Rhodospirillaceae bacterium]
MSTESPDIANLKAERFEWQKIADVCRANSTNPEFPHERWQENDTRNVQAFMEIRKLDALIAEKETA